MNENNYYKTIGANIRTFRVLQHITQKDLASRLHKSLACISKYERGEISIDTYTLNEISNELNVSLQMLLPVNDEMYETSNDVYTELPSIFQNGLTYMYVYLGHEKRLSSVVISVDKETLQATLYFDVDINKQSEYKKCKFIMTGEIYMSQANVRIYCANPLLYGDFMLVCFSAASLLDERPIGSCTTLSRTYRFLTIKCMLSRTKITNTSELILPLSFTKEDLTNVKRNHQLLI